MSELSILAAKLELEAKELEEFLAEHLAGKSNQDDRQALLTVCLMLGVKVPEEPERTIEVCKQEARRAIQSAMGVLPDQGTNKSAKHLIAIDLREFLYE